MATIASTSRSPAGRLVELAAVVIAAIIVLHIIFVLIGANGAGRMYPDLEAETPYRIITGTHLNTPIQ